MRGYYFACLGAIEMKLCCMNGRAEIRMTLSECEWGEIGTDAASVKRI